MQELLEQYASIAPLIVFLALVIAAFNIPISEDLTVIASGLFIVALPPLVGRESDALMHLALIAGAVVGDMLSYTMGRKVGRPLLGMRLFRAAISPHRLELLDAHFARHSALMILLGRLIPFGVRNCISLFAGITRLPAWKFLLFDTISASFSISVIYYLSKRYSKQLPRDIRIVQLVLLLIFIAIVAYLVYRIRRLNSERYASSARDIQDRTVGESANVYKKERKQL